MQNLTFKNPWRDKLRLNTSGQLFKLVSWPAFNVVQPKCLKTCLDKVHWVMNMLDHSTCINMTRHEV